MGELDIGRFHGVGPVTAARMKQHGILTGADLRARAAEELDALFGKAGLVLATFGLGGLLYALFARRIVPRFGEGGVARIAGGLFLVAFLGIATAPDPILTAPACLIGGAAYYLLHSVLQVNASQMTPAARGAGMSMFATSFFLGQGAGVAAAAPIVDRYGATAVFVIAAIGLPALALFVAARVATSGARA